MARVLIVDDERGLRLSLRAFLTNDGYEVETAQDVSAAMGVLERGEVDVVVSDIIMPGETGVQLLARIHERNRGIAVILLTGEPNVETAAEAVRQGAFDYLSKPVTKAVLLATVARAARAKAQHDENLRLAVENETYREDLEGLVETRTGELSAALRGTIGALGQALERRDPYTAGHQRRVAGLSQTLGEALGLPVDVLEGIEMAALVHDVGKIAVPSDILSKPTRLSRAEFDIIKEHSTVGFEILKDVRFPWPIAQIVQQHHERLDGSGYPLGLSGDAIRLEARIIGVADVVEAMASHRPYRAALGIEVALEEIGSQRGSFFDPSVVDACLRLFRDGDYALET
ncbi:MAG: HD domain-containing phosphohydrolase [Pseudomonadota bacterium]